MKFSVPALAYVSVLVAAMFSVAGFEAGRMAYYVPGPEFGVQYSDIDGSVTVNGELTLYKGACLTGPFKLVYPGHPENVASGGAMSSGGDCDNSFASAK